MAEGPGNAPGSVGRTLFSSQGYEMLNLKRKTQNELPGISHSAFERGAPAQLNEELGMKNAERVEHLSFYTLQFFNFSFK